MCLYIFYHISYIRISTHDQHPQFPRYTLYILFVLLWYVLRDYWLQCYRELFRWYDFVPICTDQLYTKFWGLHHYSDVIKSEMASQVTSLPIFYSTVYSGADQRKHQISASLPFVTRWPVNSLQKRPVTRKTSPFNDVIMIIITGETAALCQ